LDGDAARAVRDARYVMAPADNGAPRVVAAPSGPIPLAIVTGSGGLVGSEAVAYLCELGYDVIGIDNDFRARFFGGQASTKWRTRELLADYESFQSFDCDIRDTEAIDRLFRRSSDRLELVIHAAAQPSHDWAATEPLTDFTVNANGTLNLLEATRRHRPDATFVFTSTNKVYGDRPNALPLVEVGRRLDLPREHRWYEGIDASMSIDSCLHSLFGASKAAADLLVQEYGRYFGMPTVVFRGGCLTGPSHSGARLHGFLSYLMRCTVTGAPYTVYGYGGLQVRDNLHSADLVRAFAAFHASPRPGAVYNIGGGREASCSVLEAIDLCDEIAGRPLDWTVGDEPRVGDHRWWITDLRPFRRDYPTWDVTYDVESILREIHSENVEQWAFAAPRAASASSASGPSLARSRRATAGTGQPRPSVNRLPSA
jgi:CDP-paratose 2-epimerase